jgi:hypothetical protein
VAASKTTINIPKPVRATEERLPKQPPRNPHSHPSAQAQRTRTPSLSCITPTNSHHHLPSHKNIAQSASPLTRCRRYQQEHVDSYSSTLQWKISSVPAKTSITTAVHQDRSVIAGTKHAFTFTSLLPCQMDLRPTTKISILLQRLCRSGSNA